MGIPLFHLTGNLNGKVPRYLDNFLSAAEFDHASQLLSELLTKIKDTVAIAPTAPGMPEFTGTVTKCYYETKAFCEHVAPSIYHGYLAKIEGLGNDYEGIAALWQTTYQELRERLPEFIAAHKELQNKWNEHSAAGEVTQAAEYAKSFYYWGTNIEIAKEFLKMCEINSSRLKKLNPNNAS